MSKISRLVLIGSCLAVLGAAVASVFIDWEAAVEVLDRQTRRAEAKLFRLGELHSMAAAFEQEHDIRPELSYELHERGRVLSLVFPDPELPKGTTAERHARELALFATDRTKKSDQIDVVEVRFRSSAEPAGAALVHAFTLAELSDAPPPSPASASSGPSALPPDRTAAEPGEEPLGS